MSKTRNIVVFYHDPCADGAAAAWAFRQKHKDEEEAVTEYIPLQHGRPEDMEATILNAVSSDSEVFFLDIAPKLQTLEKLTSPAEREGSEKEPVVKSITVWDHHASVMEGLKAFQPTRIDGFEPPRLTLGLDIKNSGAGLAWKLLFGSEKAPDIIEWVEKMDPPITLRTNRDYAVAAFIDSHNISTPEAAFSTFDELATLSTDQMVQKGNAILADQINNTEKALRTIMFAELEVLPGKRVWVPLVNANVQNFGRRVHDALRAEGDKIVPGGVSGAWFVQGDGSVALSVRTNGTPNAGEIAKHLGATIAVSGGGHATDAGVQFKDLEQFIGNVKLFTRDQVRRGFFEQTPDLGKHTRGIKNSGNTERQL